MAGKSVGVFYSSTPGLSRKQAASVEPDMWTTPEEAHKWLDMGLATEVHSNPWRIKLKTLTQEDVKIAKLLAELVRGESCKPGLRLMVKAIIEERAYARIALNSWAGFVHGSIASKLGVSPTKGVPQIRTAKHERDSIRQIHGTGW